MSSPRLVVVVQDVVTRAPGKESPVNTRHSQPGGDRSWNAEDMAKKDGVIEIEGVIVEALPNAMFRV